MEKEVSKWSVFTDLQQTNLTKFSCDRWNWITEWEAEPVDLQLARTHHWGLDLSETLRGVGGVGGLVLTRHHQANGQSPEQPSPKTAEPPGHAAVRFQRREQRLPVAAFTVNDDSCVFGQGAKQVRLHLVLVLLGKVPRHFAA
jgi:hypothetical protein